MHVYNVALEVRYKSFFFVVSVFAVQLVFLELFIMALEGVPCSEVASSFITIIVVRFVSFSHYILMQAWRGSRR